jgi:hypothetical protein
MFGSTALRSLAISCVALLLVSCASTEALPPVSLDLFVPAPADDPWEHKIRDWQARHDQDSVQQGKPSENRSELAQDYEKFSRDLRRRLVADAVAWVQERSRKYYRADANRDHWATLSEVIETGSDDCDGLDLLTFVLLRRLGFQDDEIYRSIVVEQESGQHHMVTLWFEGGSRTDPFVLDPTGVVTRGMVRLSEIKGWEPIQLFDERSHYRVETSPAATSVAGR